MGFCAENAISLRLKSIFVVFLLAALSLGNANAAAVTVVCPGTDELSGTDDILRQQQLRAKDAFGVACDSYGGEDILGTGANTDLDPPWDLLGKSNSSNNPLSGKLNLLDGYSFSSGLETRFKVAPTLWDSWTKWRFFSEPRKVVPQIPWIRTGSFSLCRGRRWRTSMASSSGKPEKTRWA